MHYKQPLGQVIRFFLVMVFIIINEQYVYAVSAEPIYSSDSSIIPELDVPVIINSDGDAADFVAQKIQDSHDHSFKNIDFRRTKTGDAKIILTLPAPNTVVNVKIIQQRLQIDIAANIINIAKKRFNVLDFATSVTFIEAQTGANNHTQITVHQRAKKNGIHYQVQRNGLKYTITLTAKKSPSPQVKKAVIPFQGEKLSLNFQDIEVRAVLQILADFTKQNIAVNDSVQGSITLSLKDVPWDQALDIILKTKNLSMRKSADIIWIAPAEEVAAKEQSMLEAEQRKQALRPLISTTIRINFAKAKHLAVILKESKGNTLLSTRGSVAMDERTNTLLIQDTASQIVAIKKLIKTLDIPVKQVLIESRIVVANNEFSKNIGARFGVTSVLSKNNHLLSSSGSSAAAASLVNSSSDNLLRGNSLNQANIPSLNDRLSINLPTIGAAGTLGFSILSKGFLLDLELSALQAESRGEIIATPRVITLNQNTARIEQGIEIPYQQSDKNGTTSTAFKKAVLSMDVTPQITPNAHIVIDLKVHQDSVGQVFANVPSINTRAIQTKVLVKDGQTIVLGGVHEETNLKSNIKVPVLGDIPVLGRLFRQTQQQKSKRELLIFVTPKIISNLQ
jgi:type IV pilus assembly protein PilQ